LATNITKLLLLLRPFCGFISLSHTAKQKQVKKRRKQRENNKKGEEAENKNKEEIRGFHVANCAPLMPSQVSRGLDTTNMLPISEEQQLQQQQQQQQLEQLHHPQIPEIPIPDLEQVETQVGDGSLWTALYDYDAQGEDELTLRRGEIVVVLSTDSEVSGDVGWWTGKIGDKVIYLSYNVH